MLPASLLVGLGVLQARAEANSGPHSVPELQKAIEAILKETKTPGAAIALVTSNQVERLAGIGKADVVANLPVTPDTLFRLGSVSKGFVALAALQLQEAGKLKLTDTVRQWVPDVAFANPWEVTNPVRLVHLMEHTSGFDEMHLREYALNDPAITLNAALAFGASSRVCRWPPGTRMAYCNSGPAVLAAVIEKASGERFEDYIQKHVLQPLHMDGASYLYTPEVQRRLSKLYRPDGVTPYPYWHLGLRPTAGLNASARDMANYLRLLLQRGSLDGTQLLQAASIERMERGETLSSAKLGRIAAYGLFNYESVHGPFVFHGHNGAVMGDITEMGYLPGQGCGYVVMINSGSFIAAWRIANLVRDYLQLRLTPPPLPPVVPVPDQLKQHYAGYYQDISPMMQWSQGINRWLNSRTLTVTSNGLAVSFHGFSKHRVLPVTERLYRNEDASLSTLALLPDADGHTLIQCREGIYERIPALEYWAQLAGVALVCALVVSSLVMAPVWMVRRWLGKSRNPGPLSVRLLPLLSALLLTAFAVLLASGFRGLLSGQYIDDVSLGTPNLQTVSLWLASLGFPLAAAASLYVVWRERHTPMKRAAYWYSVLVALTMAAAAVYHGWWGLIGLRLWS
ncbi:MAG TPA: serine hydrolase domain-containing protein [Candidatus Acidoferrum sp.]|nr:serine hydrolase domain-containing protein [Candidatus Acidoferrum sp.]